MLVLEDHSPELVCGMNLALAEGLLEGLGDRRAVARLDPQPGLCCVAIAGIDGLDLARQGRRGQPDPAPSIAERATNGWRQDRLSLDQTRLSPSTR